LTHHIMKIITSLFLRLKGGAIDSQIDDYIEHKKRNAPTMAPLEKPTLKRFARFAEITDASEIEVRHIRAFEKLLKDQMTTHYAHDRALRSLRGFLRYHHARGHLCPTPAAVSTTGYPALLAT